MEGETSGDLMNAKIKFLHHTKDDDVVLMPQLAVFMAGPPAPTAFDPRSSNAFTFSMYANTESRKTNQRILVAENDKIECIGTNFGKESKATHLTKYLLGFKRKGSKRMRLVDVDHTYRLQQHIKGVGEVTIGAQSALNPAEQRRALIETFGSKKKQQQVRSALANQVDEDRIASASNVRKILSERVAQLEAKDQEMQTNDAPDVAARRDLLPPFNTETSNVEEIYDLHQLITPAEWATIDYKDLAKAVKKPSTLVKHKDQYHTAVYERLVRLSHESDKGDYKTLVRSLIYLEVLILFSELPKTIRQKPGELAQHLGVSETIVERLLRDFAQSEMKETGQLQYSRPQTLVDKLITYILVLLLIAENFEFSIENICKDLKLSHNKLILYLKETGCKVESSRKRKHSDSDQPEAAAVSDRTFRAKLTAPLSFPKPSKGPQRR
eukprot:GILJ01006176.1.p1 GENE.GILJ01006176.1~~GILJ01006176.1.p1  ORF type:complete len:456 (-),score=71.29 GILJ01006176.1:34-1353(-)